VVNLHPIDDASRRRDLENKKEFDYTLPLPLPKKTNTNRDFSKKVLN